MYGFFTQTSEKSKLKFKPCDYYHETQAYNFNIMHWILSEKFNVFHLSLNNVNVCGK